LILASLSTISMSHMQDVILEKTRSGRYYCLFLPILYSCIWLIEIVDRLARIKLSLLNLLKVLLILASLSTIDSSWSRINSKFLKSIRIQESLILASLSTISMSHMQDVILEKTRSGRYYCLFLFLLRLINLSTLVCKTFHFIHNINSR